jgi:hypothetical protein
LPEVPGKIAALALCRPDGSTLRIEAASPPDIAAAL